MYEGGHGKNYKTFPHIPDEPSKPRNFCHLWYDQSKKFLIVAYTTFMQVPDFSVHLIFLMSLWIRYTRTSSANSLQLENRIKPYFNIGVPLYKELKRCHLNVNVFTQM